MVNEGPLGPLGTVNPRDDEGYLDAYMQPDYVAEERSSRSVLHGMILSLVPNKKLTLPKRRLEAHSPSHCTPNPLDLKACAVQMRMVLVAGVISAHLRIESHETAEDDSDNSKIAKVHLTVKISPNDVSQKEFVDDLNKAIIDGTEGMFKLGSVDFWETTRSLSQSKSGKDTPAEKSTEFAESELNDDLGMYLDDDEKLAGRVLSGKKNPRSATKAAKPQRPWSMFNPSSALGLNSMFNSPNLLEMVEYDEHEAEARIAEESSGKTENGGFGFLKRWFR